MSHGDRHHSGSRQGLYHPGLDRDSCGIGFVADIKGRKSRAIVEQGLEFVLADLVARRLGSRGLCRWDTAVLALAVQFVEQGLELRLGDVVTARCGWRRPCAG